MTGLHTGHCRVRGNGGAATARAPRGRHASPRCSRRPATRPASSASGASARTGSTGVPTQAGLRLLLRLPQPAPRPQLLPRLPAGATRTKVPLAERRTPTAENVADEAGRRTPPTCSPRRRSRSSSANKDRPFFLYLAHHRPARQQRADPADGNGIEVPDRRAVHERALAAAGEEQRGDDHAAWTPTSAGCSAKLKRARASTRTRSCSSPATTARTGRAATTRRSSTVAGPLRGIKRDLTDGGIRVPMIVRWPGSDRSRARSATTSGRSGTSCRPLAELAGAEPPAGPRRRSPSPRRCSARGEQKRHDFLYWEFHEGGSKQAVRAGNWKAIRPRVAGPLELYDLAKDIGEGERRRREPRRRGEGRRLPEDRPHRVRAVAVAGRRAG